MDEFTIQVEVDNLEGAVHSDCYQVRRLHFLLYLAAFQLVADQSFCAHPADAFLGPIQPGEMECLLAHDAKGEISLVDGVDTDLHVLFVLDGVAMIDVVEILIIEDALDVGL